MYIWRLAYVVVVVGVIVIVGATTVFESYTEGELLRKIARFRGLWRQHWDCISGELGYKLWWFINDNVSLLGVAPR